MQEFSLLFRVLCVFVNFVAFVDMDVELEGPMGTHSAAEPSVPAQARHTNKLRQRTRSSPWRTLTQN